LFVIDSGRVKEERYDASRHVASLEDVWISKASAKQRRGRAGRVRAGLCVHLFPSDAPLAEETEPEVRRVALEQLVLRIKALPAHLLPATGKRSRVRVSAARFKASARGEPL
jgi:ATP-dependent RNA helicase DHX57